MSEVSTSAAARGCRRGVHWVVLLCVLSACKSLSEQRETDAAEVRSLVAVRGGQEPGAPPCDDTSIVPLALELLAAPLTDDSALRVALSNNRAVRRAFEELGVASATLVQASLIANPLFRADVERFDSGTEIELSIAQPLLDLLFRGTRAEIGQARGAAERARIARELIALCFEVRRALLEVRAAESLLEIGRQSLAAADEARALMADLHAAGNVMDRALTVEEIAAADAFLALEEARAALAEARETLAVLLGIPNATLPWTVAGELGADPLAGLDLAALEERAVDASLDLGESRALAEADARAAGITVGERLLAAGEVGLAGKREAGAGEWGLGPALAADVPLWNRGEAERTAAEARLRARLARQVELEVEIRSAARRVSERLRSHGERVQFLRERALPLAARLVHETMQSYNAMQIGAFDVLSTRREELATTGRHIAALRGGWIARLDLEELLAGNYDARVMEHTSSTQTGEGRARADKEH